MEKPNENIPQILKTEKSNGNITQALKMLEELQDMYWIDSGKSNLDLFEQFCYQLLFEIGLMVKENKHSVPEQYQIFRTRNFMTNSDVGPVHGDKFIITAFEIRIDEIVQLLFKEDKDFREIEGISKSPVTIRNIVNTANDIVQLFVPDSWDSIPLVIELFLEKCYLSKRSELIFTPNHIADIISQIILKESSLRFDVLNVTDPFCGSGGLLFKFFEKRQQEGYRNAWFYGFEQNVQLRRIAKICRKFFSANIRFNSNLMENTDRKYDVILTNPPFGSRASVSEDIELDVPIKTKNTYLLYIQNTLLKLSPGGVCAIIAPDGFLFNISGEHQAVRRWMLEKFCIKGIITLPQFAFAPFTNLNSSIIILSKPEEHSHIDESKMIFYYEVLSDGFSKDTRRKKIPDNDLIPLPQIWSQKDFYLDKWMSELEKKSVQNVFGVSAPAEWKFENIWFVPVDEVLENDSILLLQRYRLQKDTRISTENPIKILKTLLELEDKSSQQLKLLMEGIDLDDSL